MIDLICLKRRAIERVATTNRSGLINSTIVQFPLNRDRGTTIGCWDMRDEFYTTALPGSGRSAKGHVKAPFGYYGAKQRLVSRIVEGLPPHNAWVEAFCGSAALTLAKARVPIEVINDLDGEIVNVFQQIRDNQDALCRALALTPYARSEFLEARASIRHLWSLDPLERARRFLTATMMAVNATYSDSRVGFSFSQSYQRDGREARVSRWYNLPDRLAQVVERLRNIRIENRDARELLRMFSDRPATLAYLDPPYFVKRDHKYVIDAPDAPFHDDMLDICRRAQCMILISGYDNELYNRKLVVEGGWSKETIATNTRDTTGKDYPRTEVLWKNPIFVRAVEKGRVPIRLTPQERKENKINPPRRGRAGSMRTKGRVLDACLS